MSTRRFAVCAALGVGAACTDLETLSVHPSALGAGGSARHDAGPVTGGTDAGDALSGSETGGAETGGHAESGGTLGSGARGGVGWSGGRGGVAGTGGVGGVSSTSGGTGPSSGATGGVTPLDAGDGARTEGGVVVGPPGSDYDDPVFVPACVADKGTHQPWLLGFEQPSDMVSALVWTTKCCALYATQPASEVALLAWAVDGAPPAAPPYGWYGWQCFDAVPKITRMAALNLSSHASEEYALSTDSNLWVKREYPVADLGRGPWEHVARPSGIRELRDIHAFRRDPFRPVLLALSEGAVFMRGRRTDDPYAAFADWKMVGPVDATRVCGGYAGDGRIEVYAITTDGAVAVAREVGSDDSGPDFSPFDTEQARRGLESLFGALDGGMPVDGGGKSLTFTEIDCANQADGTLDIFAVGRGDLFRGTATATRWTRIVGQQVRLVAVAAQSATPLSDTSSAFRNDLTLFVTGADQKFYSGTLPTTAIDAGVATTTVAWSQVIPRYTW